MEDLRNERIGVAHAARMLGVRISDLKEAVMREEPLQGKIMPPKPIGRYAASNQMVFWLGEVMDCAEVLKNGAYAG